MLTEADANTLTQLLPALQKLVQEQGQIGNASLLRRLFVQVAEGSVDIASATQAVIPLTSVDVSAGTPDTSRHIFFLPSVVYEHATIFTYQTVGHVAGVGDTGIAGNHLHCWITKRRSTVAPKSVLADLVISNHTAGAANGVYYKVYRIAGLA